MYKNIWILSHERNMGILQWIAIVVLLIGLIGIQISIKELSQLLKSNQKDSERLMGLVIIILSQILGMVLLITHVLLG